MNELLGEDPYLKSYRSRYIRVCLLSQFDQVQLYQNVIFIIYNYYYYIMSTVIIYNYYYLMSTGVYLDEGAIKVAHAGCLESWESGCW